MKKYILSTTPMELVSAVVLKEQLESVAQHLVQLGIFQPMDIRDIEEELRKLSSNQAAKEYDLWADFESQLNDLSKGLGLLIYPRKDFENISYEEVKQIFQNIKEKIDPVVQERNDLTYELKKQEAFLDQVKNSLEKYPFKADASFSFIEAVIGKINERDLEFIESGLGTTPHVVYPVSKDDKKITVVVIGLRRDKPLIDKVLKEISWETVKPKEHSQDIPENVEANISSVINECKQKLDKVNKIIDQEKDKVYDDLSKIKTFILLRKSLFEVKRYSCATEKTAVIAGWVPQDQKERVIKEIKTIAPVSCIESKDADNLNLNKEDIPVKLKHNALLKPFELLIEGYGLPRYGSIDPTIFVAITFFIMFGVMFADIGHGLVLSLIGFFMFRSPKEKVKQSALLLFYCGLSAMIFGSLFGSIFGKEFHGLWLKPMHDINSIFKVSIFFGVGVISMGIVLNIVNAIKDHNYLKVFWDKAGLVAIIVYWAGIALISKVFTAKTNLPGIYLGIVGLGLLTFFCKPFIEVFIHKKRESFIVLLMEGIIEVVEIVMGYLASTVSFIRVAAFSLAHAGLFIAIFELSRLVQQSAGGFASLIVVIFGNILVIVLEGIVVSIQSLRLNYYEFFSKFFISGKKEFKPLKIDSNS